MCKSWTSSYPILTSNCDLAGAWRPSAILEACQEAAGVHSHQLGVGRLQLIHDRIVWVLIRGEVEMDRYPRIGETVEIETFHRPTRHWFFPRYFRIRSQETGEELGRCGSMWMLLNLDTRRSVPPGSVSSRMPDNSDMEPTLDHLPIQVQPLAADPEIIPYVPVYSDLDVNGHVNNARYMDLCCNTLGIHCMESMQLKHFAINYHAEIRPDQNISLLLRREDNRFSCTGMRDTEACFDICGELAPRN